MEVEIFRGRFGKATGRSEVKERGLSKVRYLGNDECGGLFGFFPPTGTLFPKTLAACSGEHEDPYTQ